MENKDWKNLILSIGELNIRKINPIEAALLIKKALDSGMSRKEIAEKCLLADPSMIGKLYKLLKVQKNYWHLIDWGSEDPVISMTTAEIISSYEPDVQDQLFDSVIKYNFNKTEVNFIGQRIKRSGLTVEECIIEGRNNRHGPEILCYVILGTFNKQTQDVLSKLTQYQRDEVIHDYFNDNYCDYSLKVKSKVTGFTVIISEQSVNDIISKDINKIEKELNEIISKTK